ncbi:hypothetical protein [Chitinophaga qingshengii]|uniref:Uncharacterized protein n=1 Tax=Chitinophaga qingshengii TaxID=1569794 RepID=A0ABR7TIJ4_9BACT|nr:hypothetical protein [Chitinophaga qingshengii]MBC9929778.1 hypothetical protein [Chitinophaga qingshengii]
MMFENIQIVTFSNNIPNTDYVSWTPKSRLWCLCELSVGFGDVMVWDEKNAIPLNTMIGFMDFMMHSLDSPEGESWTHDLPHAMGKITLQWTVTAGDEVNFSIFQQKQLMQKTVSKATALSYRHQFYIRVMSLLTAHVPEKVCWRVGEKFYQEEIRDENAFRIGQQVTTIPGPEIKTLRAGFVISRKWHHQRGAYIYQLLMEGKVTSRWYDSSELALTGEGRWQTILLLLLIDLKNRCLFKMLLKLLQPLFFSIPEQRTLFTG